MKWADGVFEGGGVKGVALVGAAAETEARGYRWRYLAGTSAGAIVASLLAAGYAAEELYPVLASLDYQRFLHRALWQRLPLVGPVLSLWLKLGLYGCDPLEAWLAELLAAKGVTTFADLQVTDAIDPRYRFRLRVIASDLSLGRLLILPQDITRYGLRPEELSVARAVRMSCSIPFFFAPVRLPNRNGGKSIIVDGGVLSNFPVWLFDGAGPPACATFGFKLVEPGEGRPHRIRGPISLLAALIATMGEAHDARYIEDKDFVRTISIATLGVRATDFDLSRRQAQELYAQGQAAAASFLDQYSFEDYLAVYRGRLTAGGRRRRLRQV